jgi:hypothetical protein
MKNLYNAVFGPTLLQERVAHVTYEGGLQNPSYVALSRHSFEEKEIKENPCRGFTPKECEKSIWWDHWGDATGATSSKTKKTKTHVPGTDTHVPGYKRCTSVKRKSNKSNKSAEVCVADSSQALVAPKDVDRKHRPSYDWPVKGILVEFYRNFTGILEDGEWNFYKKY